ncbi:MAG: DNA methyltransferase [Ktedonobacteraceae bacterium]
MTPLQTYLVNIERELQQGNATEHTHRPALKTLIETLYPNTLATNEPKRIKCGAPDYIITKEQIPLGHIEAKDIGISLAQIESDAEKSKPRTREGEQLKRYLESLSNLILTDYLEFRWYVKGKKELVGRLATVKGMNKLISDKDGAEQVKRILQSFMQAETPTVTTPRELAARMAGIARLIRITIEHVFEDKEEDPGSLQSQFESFKQVLNPDLTPQLFADRYAQTISYGIFAARCNHTTDTFTRRDVIHDIPKTNPFLLKMFNYIAGVDLDERINWAVDSLAELLNRADIDAILKDFGKRTRQEDPIVHFYETFLSEYDRTMKVKRGVYYTPEPVVSYIVRSVDSLLKISFNLSDGLADTSKIQGKTADGKSVNEAHRVQILDPATGTGTFLHSVIDLIHESFAGNQGMWSSYVSRHLLPRIFGLELLMAPYVVAHMKLDLQLKNTGYDFKSAERLRIYLTNTLEESYEGGRIPFAEWLVEEAAAAGYVKYDVPVMVVLGNPPYSYKSSNIGKWISTLVRDYYQVDGKPLDEQNPKALQDDYVKFIRFAQWRIQRTGYGILAFITNHRYLENPTCPGMRQSLMRTFDDIYLLNLHGSSKPKEIPPSNVTDKNVFDIQQGVAIGIFVKHLHEKKEDCTVYYADLWGLREPKYTWLSTNDTSTTQWTRLNPQSPTYLFIPEVRDRAEEYEHGWKLTDIMPVNSVGLYTARDHLAIQWTEAELQAILGDFISLPIETAREKYHLGKDSRDWQVALAQKDLRTLQLNESNIQKITFRPFDTRFTYYTGRSRGLICRPRPEVMRNMIGKHNLAICFMRNSREQTVSHFYVANQIVDKTILSSADNANVAPLYIYPNASPQANLFTMNNSDASYEGCHPNLAPLFTEQLALLLDMQYIQDGKGDLEKTFGPEDVFSYMYAVFYSPSYRKRYAELIKKEFPRLPLTCQPGLFRSLCKLGSDLITFHLMQSKKRGTCKFNISGRNVIETVDYKVPGQVAEQGRVLINKEQYMYLRNGSKTVWDANLSMMILCTTKIL